MKLVEKNVSDTAKLVQEQQTILRYHFEKNFISELEN